MRSLHCWNADAQGRQPGGQVRHRLGSLAPLRTQADGLPRGKDGRSLRDWRCRQLRTQLLRCCWRAGAGLREEGCEAGWAGCLTGRLQARQLPLPRRGRGQIHRTSTRRDPSTRHVGRAYPKLAGHDPFGRDAAARGSMRPPPITTGDRHRLRRAELVRPVAAKAQLLAGRPSHADAAAARCLRGRLWAPPGRTIRRGARPWRRSFRSAGWRHCRARV